MLAMPDPEGSCERCGGPLPPPAATGRPRRLCETCSPRRVNVATVTPLHAATRPPRGRRRRGPVARAAAACLPDLDTDHAGGDVLLASLQRLAGDVDNAATVRERVVAVRAVLDVLAALDTAVMPAPPPADVDDDPFQIGQAVPGGAS